jgi:hypothetical protein
MKAGCPESMKFKRTARRLRPLLAGALELIDVSTVLAGLLERLWQAAAKDAPRGDIGKFTDEEIAEAVGWLGAAEALLEILIAEGWLDRSTEHRLLIHDWPEHAPNWVKGNIERKGGWAALDAAPEGNPNDRPKGGPKGPPKAGVGTGLRGTPPSQAMPNHSKSSPSSPPPIAGWGEVEEELLSVGLVTAPELTQAVAAHGCSPDEARSVLEHWRRSRPAWEPGGLAQRLRTLRPNQDPADSNLWPPKSEQAAAAEKSAKRDADAAAARERREADRHSKQLAAGVADRLEVAHGAELDKILRSADRWSLFVKAHGDEATARVEMKRFPDGKLSAAARVPLLEALAAGKLRKPLPSRRANAIGVA